MTKPPLCYFWCDGVLTNLPEGYYYSRKQVNDRRKVSLRAFIGVEGQNSYTLILRFGPKALSRYARGLDICSCMPGPEDTLDHDESSHTISIWLR